MIRAFAPAAAVIALLLGAAAAPAQVRVVKKPASPGPDEYVVYQDWWVSAALRDDDTPSVLGSRFNTLADAQAYARRWLTVNHASSPPGSWTRIKFIEIDGEPTLRKKDQPSLPSFDQLAVDALTGGTKFLGTFKNVLKGAEKLDNSKDLILYGLAKDNEPSAGLKDYVKSIQDAYDRAKKLKEGLLGTTGRLTDEQFKKVNDAIKQYNDLVSNPPPGANPAAAARLPRMTIVTEDTIKAARDYAEARKADAELRQDKDRLDQQRDALAGLREQLDRQARELDQILRDAEEMRRRATSDYLAGSALDGWLGVRSNTLSLRFQANGVVTGTSSEDRRRFTGTYTLDGNRIRMVLGPSTFEGTITGDTISGTRSRTDGRNDTWSFTFRGKRPDIDGMRRQAQEKAGQAAERRQALSAAKATYRSRAAAYTQARAAYQARLSAQRERLERLKEHTQPRPNLVVQEPDQPIPTQGRRR